MMGHSTHVSFDRMIGACSDGTSLWVERSVGRERVYLVDGNLKPCELLWLTTGTFDGFTVISFKIVQSYNVRLAELDIVVEITSQPSIRRQLASIAVAVSPYPCTIIKYSDHQLCRIPTRIADWSKLPNVKCVEARHRICTVMVRLLEALPRELVREIAWYGCELSRLDYLEYVV